MERKSSVLKSKWFWIVMAAVVVLVAAGVLFATRHPVEPVPGIEVTAEMADESHISLSGLFTVTDAPAGLDMDMVASRLTFEPFLEFTLEPAEAEGSYLLRTFRPLEAGKELALSWLREENTPLKSWTFRTEEVFRVAGTFPADGATGVPTSSAIEIVLSYSDVDVVEMENYITVNGVDVDITIRKNTLVVTPKERDLPGLSTVTVAVSGALPRLEGEALGDDYSFSFTTGVEETQGYQLNSRDRMTENVLPGEDIYLKITVGEALEQLGLTTTIYKYPDAAAYKGALRSYRDLKVSENYSGKGSGYLDTWSAETAGLTQVISFESIPMALDERGWDKHIIVPEQLEEGWYVARIQGTLPSGSTVETNKLIQVNSLSVYSAQTRDLGSDERPNQLIAWVNDTETGQPIENARVSVAASNYYVSGATDPQGLTTLEGKLRPLSREGYNYEGYEPTDALLIGVLSVEHEGTEFHDLYGNHQLRTQGDSNNYMAYLFTDRPVYRHTDMAKVWGLIQPYQEDTVLPEGLRLVLGDDAAEVPISLEADGTFQTELRFESYRDDWARLAITDSEGRNTYHSLQLKLEEYVKPEYITTATANKLVYRAWEDPAVTIDFTAHYYEGTPARAYSALLRPPEGYQGEEFPFGEVAISTDADGKASASFAPREGENTQNSWRPQTVHYDIYSTDELNAPQIHGGTVSYLFRDVALRLELGDDGTSITVRTNLVDISRVGEEKDLLVEDNLIGAATDVPLKADVCKIYYRKTPNGERYDAINKVAVTNYDYEYTEEVIDTITATTINGIFVFEDLPAPDEQANYYLKVTVTDHQNKPVVETLYYKQDLSNWSGSVSHQFQFFKQNIKLDNSGGDIHYSDLAGHKFVDGETMDLQLTDFKEYIDDPMGKVLYTLSQDQIFDIGIADGTKFKVDFIERQLPNYVISGAYYDGKHVYATDYTKMTFNPEKRELTIDIQPARERYFPGDTATVDFKVTDKATGLARRQHSGCGGGGGRGRIRHTRAGAQVPQHPV